MKLDPIKKCNHCTGDVIFVCNAIVYGKPFGYYPFIYLCKSCGARVGVHKGTNNPLGYLASEEERKARIECKPYFESLWRGTSKKFSRDKAYYLLAKKLGIEKDLCHWAMFDVDMCHKAKEICEELMK